MISGEFKIEKEFEVKNNLQMHVTSMDKINSCAYINVKIFAHGNRTFINIDVPFTNEENTISIGSEVSLFFSIENDLEERKKITKEKINNSIDNLRRYLSRYDDIFTKDDELTITIDKNAFYLRKEQAFLYAGQVFPRFKFMRKSFFELSKKTVSKESHIDAGIRAKIEITALIASIFGKESSINEYLHYKFLRYGL